MEDNLKEISISQKQLLQILGIFHKKGNEHIDIKTKDFVHEMAQNIQELCSTNSENTN